MNFVRRSLTYGKVTYYCGRRRPEWPALIRWSITDKVVCSRTGRLAGAFSIHHANSQVRCTEIFRLLRSLP